MSLQNKPNASQPQLVMKVVFVGDTGVGKTSLLSRQYDNSFTEKHIATIGVDFRIKVYDLGLLKVKAQLWDTAGQERFRSIQKPYYKGAKAIFLCFSLADRQSFLNLDKWIDEIVNFEVPTETMFLIGCKSDLDVQVATDEIILYAERKKVHYYQTSALTGEGVHEAFQNIMVACAQKEIQEGANRKKEQKPANNINIQNIEDPRPVKKTCC